MTDENNICLREAIDRVDTVINLAGVTGFIDDWNTVVQAVHDSARKLAEIRKEFKNLYAAAGCDCCRDDDSYFAAADRLGELLLFKVYPDYDEECWHGSKYDFYEREASNDDQAT